MNNTHTLSIKQKITEINWWIVSVVIICSYGFLLANQSIGIDDENFDFYFKNDGVVSSGRWGSWLIRHVLDSYAYLPVWRDFLAILILLCAAVLFLCIYEYIAECRLEKKISTIGVSLIIAYPIIAKMYIYIDNSVETALCILLALLAYASWIYQYPWSTHKNWMIRAIATTAFLVLGCSLIENTIAYFCVELCLFGVVSKKNNLLNDIVKPLCLCICSVCLTKIFAHLIAEAKGMTITDYATGSYFKWSEYSSFDDISANLLLLKSNYTYWFREYTSVKLFVISCILWIVFSIFFIKKKDYGKAIYAIGIVVSSNSMYIITGNASLPLRIFTTYYISVVGLYIYVFLSITDGETNNLRIVLRKVMVISSFFIIFYMTKETNEYYQLDFKRYLRDADVARNVNYDLEKLTGVTPKVPVVFIGQPEQYGDINTESEVAFFTIYSNNYDGESIRIHRFFDMLGYKYPDVINEEITMLNYGVRTENELIKQAKEISKQMPEYPYEGYIRVLDNMIIVNLGDEK